MYADDVLEDLADAEEQRCADQVVCKLSVCVAPYLCTQKRDVHIGRTSPSTRSTSTISSKKYTTKNTNGIS